MKSKRREFRMFWAVIPIIIVIGIVSIFAVSYFLGVTPIGRYPQFYYFPWWIIFPLFFFGLFFFAFRWCSWGWRWSSSYNYDDHALEVLRERYAHGEIDKEQYDQIRRNLEAS